MFRSYFRKNKMCGVAFTGVVLALCLRPLQGIPSTVFSNEVYPESHLSPSLPDVQVDQLPEHEPPFSLALTRNMSQVTTMREFIMKYIKDERICQSESLMELILGNGKNDRAAKVWWAKRCDGLRSSSRPSGTSNIRNLPESTLIRYRRKSSNRASSQQIPSISAKDQKKLNKLWRNKNIKCNPKKAVVELPNDEAFTMLKPSCVYIKQCGGCCDSPHLECRPTNTKVRKFKVLALQKTGTDGASLQFGSGQTLKMVKVKEHKACQCECKERREHCTPKQIYDADACRCHCPKHLNKTCPHDKVWDEKQCECKCSDTSECTTGRFFDTESCRPPC